MTAPEVTSEMVLAMRQDLDQVIRNVTELQQFATATDMDALKVQIEEMFETKIKTAMAMVGKTSLRWGVRIQQAYPGKQSNPRCTRNLGCQRIQELESEDEECTGTSEDKGEDCP